MQVASLEIFLGLNGGAATISGLNQANTALGNLQRNARQAGSNVAGMGGSFQNAFYSLQSMGYAVRAAGQALNSVLGISYAAGFQSLEIGFTQLTGSADKAKTVLASIRQLGVTTPFNTQELSGFARILLATGDTAETVTPHLKAMADAAAGAGLSTEAVGRMAVNMSQIANSRRPMTRDLMQFAYQGISLDKIIGAAQGRTLAGGEGTSILKGMSGKSAADLIYKGLEAANPNTATIMGTQTLAGVMQNLGETLQLITLPTGKALLPVLQSVAGMIMGVAKAFQAVNDATGGNALIAMLTAMGVRAFPLLRGAVNLAIVRIAALRTELMLLSGTPRGGGVGGLSGGIYTGFGGGRGRVRGGGGALNSLRGGGAAAARGLAAAGGIGAIARGLMTRAAITGGLMAAGKGALALVGGPASIALMAATTLLPMAYNYFTSKSPGDAKPGDMAATQREIAQNTRATADGVKQMSGTGIGGGGRSKRVTSDMEVQRAVARMMATGLA